MRREKYQAKLKYFSFVEWPTYLDEENSLTVMCYVIIWLSTILVDQNFLRFKLKNCLSIPIGNTYHSDYVLVLSSAPNLHFKVL